LQKVATPETGDIVAENGNKIARKGNKVACLRIQSCRFRQQVWTGFNDLTAVHCAVLQFLLAVAVSHPMGARDTVTHVTCAWKHSVRQMIAVVSKIQRWRGRGD